MPINYSKWDALELSDDSDIEEHPNVDKKSFIRMKQRHIHEQRAERKQRIEHLKAEGPMNATLLSRIDELVSRTEAEGASYLRRTASQLREETKHQQPAEGQAPSFDVMVSNLLQQVFTTVSAKGSKEGDEMDKALVKELGVHAKRLREREEDRKKELAKDEAEIKKHITSEDLRDGFDVSHVNKKPTQAVSQPAPKPIKGKSKEQTIEVLNPGPAAPAAEPVDEDDEELPDLTPAALAFSKIKPSDYSSSFAAISKDPKLYTDEEATDALLVEAFNAEMRGDKVYAQGCVHQSLLLQYCRKLGKDGVALFFKKVSSGDPKAYGVFIEDVHSTYKRISERCAVIKSERAAAGPQEGEETIQLVAQDPSTVITFEVPEGPPPAELVIEGPEAENMDVEKVREFLQNRWDTFRAFPEALQAALKTKKLDEVNKVLGRMQVAEAEEVVKQLDEAGIMSFSSTDIIDQTGKQ